MSVGTIWGFFWKILKFCKTFQTWVKTSDFRLARFTNVLEQLLTSSDETLREKILVGTLFFKGFAFRLWVLLSNFVKMFYELLSKLHLKFPEEIFDYFDCQTRGFFSIFEHNFTEVLTVKFHHCSQYSTQHVQRNNWIKKLSLLFSKFFFILSDFFLQFWQKYFRRVAKTEFNVSGRNI